MRKTVRHQRGMVSAIRMESLSAIAGIRTDVLQASSGALETALHNGGNVDELANRLHAVELALTNTIAALQSLPGFVAAETQPLPHGDSESNLAKAQGVLEQFHVLLRNDEATAPSFWEEHRDVLGTVLPRMQEVDAAMQSFDYEAALELLCAARGHAVS